jgi:hypothetical protein
MAHQRVVGRLGAADNRANRITGRHCLDVIREYETIAIQGLQTT